MNFDCLGFEAYEVYYNQSHRLYNPYKPPKLQNEIYNVGYVTAHYLKHVLDFKKKVYLIGLSGFAHELDLQGIPHIGVGPDPMVGGPAEWAKISLDPEVSIPHSQLSTFIPHFLSLYLKLSDFSYLSL